MVLERPIMTLIPKTAQTEVPTMPAEKSARDSCPMAMTPIADATPRQTVKTERCPASLSSLYRTRSHEGIKNKVLDQDPDALEC